MDSGTIVIQYAAVDQRAGAIYVQSYDSTPDKYPLQFQGSWMKKIVGFLSDAELGELARDAMAASQTKDWPGDTLREEVARRRKALFRLAGVRSERQYQTGLSAVSVHYEAGESHYHVTRYVNRDPAEDMVGSEAEQLVPVNCPDDVLGGTIRGSLSEEGDGQR